MLDHRKPLTFGTFITPAADDVAAVVELAVASEMAGLDLVTFQDHPYQPAFLDTWTLLSFVAARTSRIRISGNVLNLPLRPPAVLARAAASLDRLSNGRVTLGLGAGAYWDAIRTMGVQRRTPGESITALEEAIGVIRQLWDADRRQPARLAGTFYQIEGARRGPAPMHDIPIWLGGYKPRSLGLVARHADGWISSLGPLQSVEEQAMANVLIDQTAAAAGRDPAAITRALNIPLSAAEPDELSRLALNTGFDTFILMSDRTEDIIRFAMDVAPATRDLVSSART